MAVNETYEKQMINGVEVMVVVETIIIPDTIAVEPTPEELQVKINELIKQASDLQNKINQLSNNG